jgi:hypothetical protein
MNCVDVVNALLYLHRLPGTGRRGRKRPRKEGKKKKRVRKPFKNNTRPAL